MRQERFWSDASRSGAIVGGVAVVGSLLAMLMNSSTIMTTIIAIAKLVIIIVLLRNFTLKRALLAKESGFSYGAGLGFILAVGLFAGVVEGTYEIFARNYFFPELYTASLNEILGIFSSSGVYSSGQLKELKELYNTILFSPIPIVLSSIFGAVLTYGFYGLFVAAYTRREVNIFGNKEE